MDSVILWIYYTVSDDDELDALIFDSPFFFQFITGLLCLYKFVRLDSVLLLLIFNVIRVIEIAFNGT